MTVEKNSSLISLGRKSNSVKTSAPGKSRHSWARTRSPPLKAGHQSCTIATFLPRRDRAFGDSPVGNGKASSAGRAMGTSPGVRSKECTVIEPTAEPLLMPSRQACLRIHRQNNRYKGARAVNKCLNGGGNVKRRGGTASTKGV